MKSHTLPVFITIAFILGIALGFCFDVPIRILYFVFGGGFLLFSTAYLRARKLFFRDWFFWSSAFFMLVVLGVLTTTLHQPGNNPSHYIHQDIDGPALMKMEIHEKLSPNPYSQNYIAVLGSYDGTPVDGKVLLSLGKDSLSGELEVGDRIALYAEFTSIYHPLNPHQFDYANYMANKRILREVRTSSNQVIKLGADKNSILWLSGEFRRKADSALIANGFTKSQFPMIEALLLGQRTYLSDETYTDFINAGVVHVLSVSGLHIGILMGVLMLLFKPLVFLPKGKTIRAVLIIFLLWIYACIAGLSPSILRSVTMFSFFSIGLLSKRRAFTLNMLCASACVLLFFNPNYFLQVGFELSYAAVLTIIVFQKKIYRVFRVKNRALDYLWQITSVTLAAQFGVMPLSLFYFHQFPGLFFLSNVATVPFLGIILGMGLLVIVLGLAGWLPHFLVVVYGWIIDALQTVVGWVADQESFLVKHIYFSTEMFVLSTLALVLLAFLIYRKQRIFAFLFLGTIIVFQLDYIYETHQLQGKERFYVFHKSRHTVLGFRKGSQMRLAVGGAAKEKDILNASFIQSLQSAEGISQVSLSHDLQNFYSISGHDFLLIDSTAVWKVPDGVTITDLLLCDSPEINLTRVIVSLNPRRVIADGSNYKSMVRLWRKTCAQMGVPFYYTGKKGALVMDY